MEEEPEEIIAHLEKVLLCQDNGLTWTLARKVVVLDKKTNLFVEEIGIMDDEFCLVFPIVPAPQLSFLARVKERRSYIMQNKESYEQSYYDSKKRFLASKPDRPQLP